MGSCQSTDTAAPASLEARGAPQTKSVNSGGAKPASTIKLDARSDVSTDSVGTAHSNHANGVKPRYSSDSTGSGDHGHFPGYSSGASTPVDSRSLDGSGHGVSRDRTYSTNNNKTLAHSSSVLGLDTMIEARKEEGDLKSNVVHIEVPFGKPIEEVYDGVHSGPVLGSGISGLVRLVTHKATGVKYAVKCLDLGLVDSAEGLGRLREEIFIMCQLDHPNIVRLEEVYESHSEIYLVQELCLGGELFDRLDEQPDYHYTEAECARLVKQMLCAVRYLHSKGIIHRDLKLENFLFSSTSADSELKMIDFGLSKHFKYGEVQHEAVGTPYTVAPEVIRGSYDERCDIWAIGVITFLLLSGDPPFGGCGGPEPLMTVRSNILRGYFSFEPEEIWSIVSRQAREFIKGLLVTNPKERPTAKEAQKHIWMKQWANRAKTEDDNKLNPNVVKALVTFKEFSDMRKLLCEVLSFTLLPDQIKDLRKEFEKMDTDGSGEISLAALKQVLMTNAGAGSLGALTEEEVEDIFNAMRVRKTETRIHWHEFIAAGLSQCQVDERNLRLAFDRLDSDHKGYITFENVMDLMGNDAAQSEDAMRRMWGDSMKACNCQHARITYDNFLLLMKGQTKETDLQTGDLDPYLGTSIKQVTGSQKKGLSIVHEIRSDDDVTVEEDDVHQDVIVLPSGDVVTIADGTITEGTPALPPSTKTGTEKVVNPIEVSEDLLTPPDVPSQPMEIEGALSMDDDDDIAELTKKYVSTLTPPQSPMRGAADYVTLRGERLISPLSNTDGLSIPSIMERPQLEYVRRRSRSVDDKDHAPAEDEDELEEPQFVADARRAMLLPEHQHNKNAIENFIKDESKTALVVNRTLYRAHRQMRLAVLEASKRFEEQQARRARDILNAQGEEEGKDSDPMGIIGAGLVMRHGLKKKVTSEAVRKWLRENEEQQEALVEKANKRGGRGRRTRKKTISDMTGMLASIEQEEMASDPAQLPEGSPKGKISNMGESDSAMNYDLHVDPTNIAIHPTMPGVFRRTRDPFSKGGLYGIGDE